MSNFYNTICYLIFFATLICLTSCSDKAPKKPLPPVRVEAGEVTQSDVPLYIEVTGNVYETSIVQIRAQVQGIVLKAHVEQGQYVEKGDLLFEIDPRPYKAILDQAQGSLLRDAANLDLAKITLNRNADLVKKDYISKLSFEQFQANVKVAEAQVEIDKAAVESAQINLDYCRIVAPISGKVSFYNVYPGNLVIVDDPNFLIEIRQITPADIRFYIPQRDFQEVQKYQKLSDLSFDVFLPYDDKRIFKGNLYFYDNHVDLQSGSILLKGLIANEDHVLWPGEFVRVRLILKVQKQALQVPFSAVQVGQKESYVYVIQPDMTVKLVNVVVGQKNDSLIIVQSGLQKGEKVVTNGQLNLRAGSPVEIVKPKNQRDEHK